MEKRGFKMTLHDKRVSSNDVYQKEVIYVYPEKDVKESFNKIKDRLFRCFGFNFYYAKLIDDAFREELGEGLIHSPQVTDKPNRMQKSSSEVSQKIVDNIQNSEDKKE